MRPFHLGDILSVTTGILLSPEGMGGVYNILNYMTNDNIYTHQIPRCIDECRPYLREQFPFTQNITKDMVRGEAAMTTLAELVSLYGEYHDVRPIHFEDHETIDPIDEVRRMNPKIEIITLEASGEDEDAN